MTWTLAPSVVSIQRRAAGENVWLGRSGVDEWAELTSYSPRALDYEVLDSEEAAGRAMLGEIEAAARTKSGESTIVILGGRGAQALHRFSCENARTADLDELRSRLN